MSDYEFTAAHTLNRVKYQVGDELPDKYDGPWLIEMGVPLRLKDGRQPVTKQPPPRAPARAAMPQASFVTSSARWSCCGKRPK